MMFSAGSDARRDDGLALLNFDESDYFWMTEQALKVADRHAHDRVVSTLEGGYNLHTLSRSVVAHTQALPGTA